MKTQGFTLIELLIVMVILGILASVVIGQVRNVREDAERTAFVGTGQTFSEAIQRFRLDTGHYPGNETPGTLPAGMEDYLSTANTWTTTTPLGGRWDIAYNQQGILSAVGVDFNGPGPKKDDAYMVQIDAAIDDGDLQTGSFQKLAGNRYYFVVAE